MQCALQLLPVCLRAALLLLLLASQLHGAQLPGQGRKVEETLLPAHVLVIDVDGRQRCSLAAERLTSLPLPLLLLLLVLLLQLLQLLPHCLQLELCPQCALQQPPLFCLRALPFCVSALPFCVCAVLLLLQLLPQRLQLGFCLRDAQ